MVAPQHMQADVVARANLGGSVPGLSGDGVDKGSHVRAGRSLLRRHLALGREKRPESPRTVPKSGSDKAGRTTTVAQVQCCRQNKPQLLLQGEFAVGLTLADQIYQTQYISVPVLGEKSEDTPADKTESGAEWLGGVPFGALGPGPV